MRASSLTNRKVSLALAGSALVVACGGESRRVGPGAGSSGDFGSSAGDANTSTSGTGNATPESGGNGGGGSGTLGKAAGNAGVATTSGAGGTSGSDATGGSSQGGSETAGGMSENGAGTGGGDAGASGNAAGTAGTVGSTGGTAGSADGGAGAAGGGTSGGNGGGGEDTVGGELTMGWIGCSMASNVSEGYQRIGGTRMWGGYAVHNTHTLAEWIEPTAEGWRLFDQYAQRSGLPKAVWIQICVVASEPELGTPTLEQVAAVVAITREHAHPEAVLYITGQPLYEEGHICTFAGEGGPELTDQLAREAAADPNLDLIYPGAFGPLEAEHISADTCHATSSGGNLLGEQALGFWG